MLNVFVHLFITLFLCLMYPYIVLCIYVFILVRKLHPLSHLLALFFFLLSNLYKNNALKTEVYSEKATPINCYPPIATSHVSGPSGLLLSSLLTWLILAILYCNRLRLRVKRKINWNWIELCQIISVTPIDLDHYLIMGFLYIFRQILSMNTWYLSPSWKQFQTIS